MKLMTAQPQRVRRLRYKKFEDMITFAIQMKQPLSESSFSYWYRGTRA